MKQEVNSIMQVYLDEQSPIVFAQVMSKEGFEKRKQEDAEAEILDTLKGDNIKEGTEKVYESLCHWTNLRKEFFVKIVKPNDKYRRPPKESYTLEGDLETYGSSFSFVPGFYTQLNQEIQEKLGLEEQINQK